MCPPPPFGFPGKCALQLNKETLCARGSKRGFQALATDNLETSVLPRTASISQGYIYLDHAKKYKSRKPMAYIIPGGMTAKEIPSSLKAFSEPIACSELPPPPAPPKKP